LYDIAVTQYGKGSAQAINAETDLIQARNSATKSHSGELGKQLKLNEGIYDSVAKQRDAMLDMEELAIRDRQQDRADQAKIRSAQAILADPRKARFHDAARDALALIDVQDRKRANELAEKSSTAGAQIIGGKLYQSAPGGALPSLGGSWHPWRATVAHRRSCAAWRGCRPSAGRGHRGDGVSRRCADRRQCRDTDARRPGAA
jgi:hypothetical protein